MTQGLTTLEGKQKEAINKISKTNSILRNVKGKVEQSGKDVTAAIDKSSAANSTALNNVQFALNTISSKLTAPFDVKVIGKVTIGNLPKDLGNGGGGGNRRTANNGQPLDVDPLVSPPFDPNDATIPVLPTKLQLPDVVVNQSPVMAKLELPEMTSPALTPKGRKPLMKALDEMVAERPVAPQFNVEPPETLAKVEIPEFIAPQNESLVAPNASPTEIINRDMFERMAIEPTQISQLIPQNTTSNRNRNFDFSGSLNVSMSGVEKTSKEMANEVAGELMRSIQEATFTELDLT